MAQVEGGDLLVIQRGQESGHHANASSTAGWRDGPWWRDTQPPRDLGAIKGLVEGTKLCRANAEGYADEYFARTGGVDRAKERATHVVSDTNPVRSSDLFLAVQAIVVATDRARSQGLFQAGPGSASGKGKAAETVDADEEDDDMVVFAIYILDPVHEIKYATVTQGIPARWIRWMDAIPSSQQGSESDDSDSDSQEEGDDNDDDEIAKVPEEIRDIVASGGVDPREWVAEWIEDALSLGVGVVAQRYVARRMGVGESGAGIRGRQQTESILEEGGSEAARAGII